MAGKDLTTTANVKTLLDISVSTYDTLLATLITAATDYIDRYLDRTLYDDAATTEYFNGESQKYLQLKRWPINSLTGVYYRSGDLDNPTWTAYSGKTDYINSAATGELFFMFDLPRGFQNIKVTFRGGYTTPSTGAPESLRLACEKLVARLFNKRKAEGILNENIGGASIDWQDTVDNHTKLLLDGHKRISL